MKPSTKWDKINIRQRRNILSNYYGSGREGTYQRSLKSITGNYDVGFGMSNSYLSTKKWKKLPGQVQQDLQGDYPYW